MCIAGWLGDLAIETRRTIPQQVRPFRAYCSPIPWLGLMGRRQRPILSVWDVDAVTSAFAEANLKVTHLRPLYGWLLRHPEVQAWEDLNGRWASVAQLRNIPSGARELLAANFAIFSSRIEARDESADGATTKLAVALSDNLRVETVVMRHGNRTTVCVSSQVGCAMGCSFCATGTMGIVGDLSAGEIVEQLLHSRRLERVQGVAAVEAGATEKKVATVATAAGASMGPTASTAVASMETATTSLTVATSAAIAAAPAVVASVRRGGGGGGSASGVRNVVFMGMGEPLNNYRAVCAAVRVLIDPSLFGMRPSSVTVSTVGIVPRMARFATDLPGVSLALSLHAPTQPQREAIMPAARAYPLPRLMGALEAHMAAARPHTPTSKVAMVEYILLRGINDKPEDAAALAALLSPHSDRLMVNLIPYNPTDATPEYRRSTEAATTTFMTTMRAAGVLTMVRRTMGDDIAGACGQLVRQQERHYAAQRAAAAPSTATATHAAAADIEDLLGASAPVERSRAPSHAPAAPRRRAAAPLPASRTSSETRSTPPTPMTTPMTTLSRAQAEAIHGRAPFSDRARSLPFAVSVTLAAALAICSGYCVLASIASLIIEHGTLI